MDRTKLQIRIINSSSIQPSGCWEWIKFRGPKGYGQLAVERKPKPAHRVSFFAWNGYWPELVRHTCDNPSCVNPEHLLSGTPADNTRDMMERRRHLAPIGERNGKAKLTSQNVLQIRLLLSSGADACSIAAQFRVHRVTILDIQSGKRWKHIF